MRLQKIRVTNFRSVDDSEEFDVDPVTCLVGKNEAGKSAILLALAALNPNKATPVAINKERDYPRRNLIRYKQIHGDEHAVVIRTIWKLDEAEIQVISEDVGKDVLTSPLVEVSRRYGKQIEVSAQLDYPAAVKHHYSLFALNASERSMLGSPSTTDKLISVLDGLQSPTEKHIRLQEFLSERGNARGRVRKHVIRALPTFMYVSSYDRMDGAIQIEETQERIDTEEIDYDEHRGARLFVEFLEYAGVAIDDITDVSTYETFNAMLQAASTNITEQILDYWSQNPDLDVEVRIDKALPGDSPPFNQGTIARARIKNNLHRVDTPFSERSAGFVWFFSFLVKFAQVKNAGGPIVLLLDEPGLSLHGKAQGDLLRFIDDKLAPSHQVIYSTHSPFMVPADKLQRVRIIEDKVDGTKSPRRSYGTKASQDVLEVEADTLFPLQGALGYEATQTLFVGEHTLLVEGPSDILYLQALSSALEARGRTPLDSRWTMCPAGGIDRIMPFVSLFAGKEMHVAVLSDVARGAMGKVERIRQSDILQAGHFYTVADFIDEREGDIEDIFDPEVYAEIVNSSYALPESHRVTIEKLDEHTSTTRLVKKVEAIFNIMPETIPVFNHYTPAAWLIRNSDTFAGESEAIDRTLSAAERIFETFNRLLN
ncbi:AAA family ATPase [Candidatus Rariloculus sp.]|uniref:AAA family ATPase n=1 Tax=Candidatus Rariloculus sp. TaxID=3101265 RepID=UPI003D0F1192